MSELHSELTTLRDRPKQVARSVVEQIREDEVTFMAGSIAYQAFVSLVPILVLLFLFVTLVGDQQLAGQVTSITKGVLPANAQQLLENAIASDGGVGSAGASVVGLVTLVWGALKLFRGLDTAFSEVYGTESENSLVDQLKDGLVVLAALVVGVVGMVGAMTVFAAFGGPLSRVLSLVALVAGLTLAFLPMYRFFPDADLEWADALPGAVVAAVGWMTLQFLFRFYIQFSSKGDSSGAIGAILLLLTWLYLSGLVLLVAAVVNAVLLGEGAPAPQTGADDAHDSDDGDTTTGGADRISALSERFHRERDRRQTLEHERARLERRLERAERTPDAEALRARNRALRRRLDWRERPLYARLAARVLGRTPPAPVSAGPAPPREPPGSTTTRASNPSDD